MSAATVTNMYDEGPSRRHLEHLGETLTFALIDAARSWNRGDASAETLGWVVSAYEAGKDVGAFTAID